MKGWLAFLLVALAGCQSGQDNSGSIVLQDVKLTDLQGQPIDLKQFENKTVLINFWATWCRPCLQEMPLLANAQTQMKGEPIVFLFASNEALERIQTFKEKQNFDFQYVHSTNMEALNVLALPTTFIFNSSGELKFSEAGFRAWDSSENIHLLQSIMASNE